VSISSFGVFLGYVIIKVLFQGRLHEDAKIAFFDSQLIFFKIPFSK
jgi:hypothetical protein